MNGRFWAGALCLLGTAACSAPTVCEEASDSLGGLVAESEQVEDSVGATNAGDGKNWKLRATLRGLPELWQGGSAILDGNLTVLVSVAYESDPVGGDGLTEMPMVRVTLGGLTLGSASVTPRFAGPAASRFSAPIFDTCVGDQKNCCPFGARECTLPITLRVERVDGAPFPAIVIDWSARSVARVSICPRGGPAPTLSLALEGQ